jgi:hypothetical protein
MKKTIIFAVIAIIAAIVDLICIFTATQDFIGDTYRNQEINKSMWIGISQLIMVVAIFIAARSKRSKRQNVEN